MSKRLKQIKTNNLGASAKKVVDSLLGANEKSRGSQKEEKLEQMRCKVEIFEGYKSTNIKHHLIDSFVVNINSLEKLKSDICDKYGQDIQYNITNLNNEEIVAQRYVYTGGYNKDKQDRESFAKQMELIRRIFKMKEDGKSETETGDKLSSYAARSYISGIYNSTEVVIIQKLRNEYGNQSLGQSSQTEILSEDLSTKKDITINDDEDIIDNKKGEKEDEE